MSNLKPLFSSKSDEWETPQALYNELDGLFHFNQDPACTSKNCKAPKGFFIDKGMDGLKEDWFGNVFVNPPYSKIKLWARKIYSEFYEKRNCDIIVCLLPVRTDTQVWQDYFLKAPHIVFIRGRLKFGGAKNSAPFPSALVIFSRDGLEK
jgi:site-specific DNA-methyltransferase (adenine-specific)